MMSDPVSGAAVRAIALWGMLALVGAGQDLPGAEVAAVAQAKGPGAAAGPAVEAFVARLGGRPWSQTVVADDGVPAGWRALQGGVHLRIMSVPPVRDVWVLPAGWVGFQPLEDPFDLIRRDGVLIAMRRELRASHVRELIDALPGGASGAPLTSPADPPFAGPADAARADQEASALCARTCADATTLNAAVASFVALGIPATTVFAQAVRSPDQEAALTAIRLVAGHLEALAGHRWVRDVDQGAIASAVLLPLLDHAETTRVGLDRQRSAAACLSRCAIRDCGAVLLDDLAHLQDAQTREAVVQALERIAYQPAAPVVLAMMEKATPAFRQSGYAKVLATLRYAPAVPVLEKLCVNAHPSADILAFDRNWLGGERLELSLLRLTAAWGAPAAGVRLLLVPYARTVAGKDCRIAVLIENLGGGEVTAIPFMQGGGDSGFVIDGVDHPDPAAPFEGCFTICQHGTWIDVCTLEPTGIAPGRHRVRYHAGGAVANEVVIDIAAAP